MALKPSPKLKGGGGNRKAPSMTKEEVSRKAKPQDGLKYRQEQPGKKKG